MRSVDSAPAGYCPADGYVNCIHHRQAGIAHVLGRGASGRYFYRSSAQRVTRATSSSREKTGSRNGGT